MESQLDDNQIKEIVRLMHDTEIASLSDESLIHEKYKLSDKFYRQMNRLIKKQKYKMRALEISKYAVACAAVVMILFMVARPNAVAEAARRFMVWMKEMVSFQFEEDTDIVDFPKYELTYVPNGFELEHNLYFEEECMGDILYHSKDRTLVFSYMSSDASNAVNDENVDVKIISYKGIKKIYYLKSYDEEYNSSMIWESDDGKITYSLTGTLTEEEFYKVIDGIKEEK